MAFFKYFCIMNAIDFVSYFLFLHLSG
jgi:hypothetical protein